MAAEDPESPDESQKLRLTRRMVLGGALLGGVVGAGSLLWRTRSAPYVPERTFPGRIGVDLGSLEARGGTFVDSAKSLRPWYPFEGDEPVSTDVRGWPEQDVKTVVFDQRPTFAWDPPIDDPAAYHPDMSGVYTLTLTGEAHLSTAVDDGAVKSLRYDEETNTTTAEIEMGPEDALLFLELRDTRRTLAHDVHTGFTDLRVIHPGYDPESEQTFRDAYLAAVDPFPVLRFMNWTSTNGHAPFDNGEPVYTRWSDRTTPETPSQHMGADGVAWEYVIDLCNRVDAHPWINVPVAADDTYVTELATLMRERLDEHRHLYIEYSNEVWNPGFDQHAWNAAMASREQMRPEHRYITRLREIAHRFEDVFGGAAFRDRIDVVHAWQKELEPDAFAQQFAWAESEFSEPVSSYLSATAITAYFSYTRDVADEGDGPDDVIEHMRQAIDPHDRYTDFAALADDHDLSLYAYEGGPNTSPGFEGMTTALDSVIEAARSEQMADLIEENLLAWFDAGGDLFIHFTLQSAYNRYGTWGLTDDINVPDRNAKYDRVLALLDAER